MSTLFEYYERELEYLRRAGTEFAERFPNVAKRLHLEPTKCDDPHVERLLEGFAFLAARVHLRLDDDFSEISESILHVIAPHYVRPIPSMTIAEFELDPEQGKQTSGHTIPRGTTLLTRPALGPTCRFRTCYDLVLWPLEIRAAQWMSIDRLKPPIRPLSGESGAFRLEFRTFPDVPLETLTLSQLRFHISGAASLISVLYEALANNTVRVIVRDVATKSPRPSIELPRDSLVAVGFGEDEVVLPSSKRSFAGYRLLTEYFAFPEKFHFFELQNLDVLKRAGFSGGFEVLLITSPFEQPEWRQTLETGVNPQAFRLNCTPTVNLFEQTSEPIAIDQLRHQYVVVPDARRRRETETYSVDSVSVTASDNLEPLRLEPFYALRHRTSRKDQKLYWVARRRATPWRSEEGADASEILLSFVDIEAELVSPESDVATARLTCFNSHVPATKVRFGDPKGDFEVEGGGPFLRVTARLRPTRVVQPPLGRGLTWRVVSQLSLNHLSVTEGGADALREILRLHDFAGTEQNEEQLAGILDVRSRPASTTMRTEHGLAAARGRLVELDLDEERFAGASLFLFATVIERFLAMYASLNSYSQLLVRSSRRRGIVRQFAPRSGWRPVL
jgi:type VI secretion system protein ImpG